jgi:hypothetical protein
LVLEASAVVAAAMGGVENPTQVVAAVAAVTEVINGILLAVQKAIMAVEVVAVLS